MSDFTYMFRLQQDLVGHYQLGQKNIVYLEMIYLGVQCMYFHAKPLQNQCILGLVHYTKQTVYLESYFDLNALKMIVKIKFDVNYVKLDLIRTLDSNNTLHQLMGNETSLAQKTKIKHSFYTFLEIVYLEMIHLGVQCMYFRAKPLQNQCILGLVHYTQYTVYLESYFDLNALKMIVKIKFDVDYVKLDLIRTFNLKHTLHQLMGNETSLAQKTKIEQSFYTLGVIQKLG